MTSFMNNPLTACLMFGLLAVFCDAKAEETVPMSDVGEGALCDQSQRAANTCLACSALPFDTRITLVTCCSDDDAMKFCDACVADVRSCSKVMDEIKEVEDFSEDEFVQDDDDYDYGYEDDVNDNNLIGIGGPAGVFESEPTDNRLETLFMKTQKPFNRNGFGALDLNNRHKRFGRLYIGSSGMFGKRGDAAKRFKFLGMASHADLNKRYGYLGVGSSRMFGKRNDKNLKDKRYGTLHMGSGGFFGKRDDEYFGSEPVKRYGNLGMGSGGFFGKRDNGADFTGQQMKRFGSLGMGWRPSKWGKRDGLQQGSGNDIDKRYGRLFMSSGGLFGKRAGFVGDEDMNTMYDDEDTNGDMNKRYGSIFLGGGSGYFGKRGDIDLDKRFGRLFMNRRKGQGTIFG